MGLNPHGSAADRGRGGQGGKGSDRTGGAARDGRESRRRAPGRGANRGSARPQNRFRDRSMERAAEESYRPLAMGGIQLLSAMIGQNVGRGANLSDELEAAFRGRFILRPRMDGDPAPKSELLAAKLADKTADALIDSPNRAALLGMLNDLCRGAQRHLRELQWMALKASRDGEIKDELLLWLICVAAYQLTRTANPPHAAVNEAVSVAGIVYPRGAKGFVNAALRSIQRGLAGSPSDSGAASAAGSDAPAASAALASSTASAASSASVSAKPAPAGSAPAGAEASDLGRLPSRADPESKARPAAQDLGCARVLSEEVLLAPLSQDMAVFALRCVERAEREGWLRSRQAGGAEGEGRWRQLVRREAEEFSDFSRRLARLPAPGNWGPLGWIERAAELPLWQLGLIERSFPGRGAQIAQALALKPPMTLRADVAGGAPRLAQRYESLGIECAVNVSTLDAGGRKTTARSLTLARAVDVRALPGFDEGMVSVQDHGAQFAALLLDPRNGEMALDACCAPGGKACHMLRLAPRVKLLALDVDPERMGKARQNFDRLGLKPGVALGDCADPKRWMASSGARDFFSDAGFGPDAALRALSQGEGVFDAILADLPCSASGVCKRNPDAKWRRRPEDIFRFADAQLRMLQALWATLKKGGRLLYATCSVFSEENALNVDRFVASEPTASAAFKIQLAPNDYQDGFFYSLLLKA